MNILDSNILIRYVTKDNPDLYVKAETIINEIKHKRIEALLLESVISETIWVLTSKNFYNITKQAAASNLLALITLQNIKTITPKRVYMAAFEIFLTTNIEFVDSLIIAYSLHQNVSTINSLDEKLQKTFSTLISKQPKKKSVDQPTSPQDS